MHDAVIALVSIRSGWLARLASVAAVAATMGAMATPAAATPPIEAPPVAEGGDGSVAPDPAALLAELYTGLPEMVWTRPAGLSAAGEVALKWLRDARHHGLLGFAPRLTEFDEYLAVLVPHAGPAAADPSLHVEPADVAPAFGRGPSLPDSAAPSEVRAALEAGLALTLSDLVARLTHHPRSATILQDDRGRYATPDSLWAAPPEPLGLPDLEALLNAASTSAEALESWLTSRLPQPGQYGLLLDAARHYATICESGGWGPVKVTRYRRGSKWKNAEAIEEIQDRLLIEGFYDIEPTGRFDEPTREALRRYQAARQVRATGTYDPETSRDLNIPCEERLAALHLNLRRWRQSSRTAQPNFVEVNLAAQEVRLVFDGQERMRVRTVVGSGKWFWSRKEQRRIYPKKSPLLTDAIQKIVVNPSWTIPGSIVKQEILPRIEKDPTYLERKGYIVKKSKSGHDIYVQPPGPGNTLGEVKLIFPNAEAIYLHDTSNRYLFRSARRDMSHGCIRVQDALDFATELLAEDYKLRDRTFHPKTLHRLSRRKKTIVFKLQQPVPVFLEYYTASVDAEGIVRFHPDVYEYDLEVAMGQPLPRRLPKALRP